MRRSGGSGALFSASAVCTSPAQRSASTTLANSASNPSPVVLTMRPAMLGDLRVDDFGAERLEPAEGPFLVAFDQARVAGDIGREDRREPTFDASWPFRLHGASPVATILHQPALGTHLARIKCPFSFVRQGNAARTAKSRRRAGLKVWPIALYCQLRNVRL